MLHTCALYPLQPLRLEALLFSTVTLVHEPNNRSQALFCLLITTKQQPHSICPAQTKARHPISGDELCFFFLGQLNIQRPQLVCLSGVETCPVLDSDWLTTIILSTRTLVFPPFTHYHQVLPAPGCLSWTAVSRRTVRAGPGPCPTGVVLGSQPDPRVISQPDGSRSHLTSSTSSIPLETRKSMERTYTPLSRCIKAFVRSWIFQPFFLTPQLNHFQLSQSFQLGSGLSRLQSLFYNLYRQ